jgi:hypothetical protein
VEVRDGSKGTITDGPRVLKTPMSKTGSEVSQTMWLVATEVGALWMDERFIKA